MKRKLREALRRILSIILMIVMLPLSSMQPAFTAIVHAEGTDDYVAESVIEESDTDEDTLYSVTPENPSEDVVSNEEDTVEDNEDVADDQDVIVGENTSDEEDADVIEKVNEEDIVTQGEISNDVINPDVDVIIELGLRAELNECADSVLTWNKAELENAEYFVYRNDELIDSFSLDEEGEENANVSEEEGLISYVDSNTTADTEFSYKVVLKVGETIYSESDTESVKTPEALVIPDSGYYSLDSDLTVFSVTMNRKSYLDLNGKELKVCKDLNDEGYDSELHFDNGSIICNGNFNVTNSYAEIYMNNPHDYLYVKGNVKLQNQRYYANYTNGVFEVAGNFTASYFNTSNYCKFILSGSERQDISINDTGAYIEYLENNNTSEDGINFVNARQINMFETNDDAKVSIYGEEVENGFTLFEDSTIDGDFSIGFGVLDLNGYTLTINGNFVQKGGDVVIGNGKLIVRGDYSIENETLDYRNQSVKALSSGRLIMNDEAGSVLIYGKFTSHSVVERDGLLTAGLFEIKGDFNQVENYGNFKASGSHTVLLSGDKKQTVKFASPSTAKSHFNNFEISNTSEEGVEFGADSTGPMAIGMVKDNGIKVVGSLVINGDTSFEDNHYCSDIFINDQTTLNNEIEIEGNFKSGYYLYLKGKLTVDGDFAVNKYDTYVYSDTYVKGNLIVGGGNSYAYMYIYGGTFTVEGDAQIKKYSYGYSYLYQNNSNSAESSFIVKGNLSLDTSCVFQGNFGTFTIGGDIKGAGAVQLSGLHSTVFNGTKSQRVEINKNSYFAKIEINNSSQEGVSFQDFYGIGELVRNGNNFSYDGMNGYLGWTLNEDTEIDGDVRLLGDTLDLNGYTLKIKGNLIQSAGVVNVNGGKLEIEGDYRIQKDDIVNENIQYSASIGKLVMTNEQDYVLVGGSFYNQSSENSDGLLTAGLLEIKGDFYQISNSTSYTFTATEKHTVKFSGDKKQTVKFSNYSNWYSYFNNLEIENASEEGVVFDSTNSVPGAKGNVKDNGNKINGQLLICDSTTFENNHYCSNILVSDSYFTLSSDIETDGDFKFSSYNITLNNKLTVGGTLSIQARNIYVNSDINVKGDLLIGGEYGNYCYTYLYEGSLVVEGNLQISRYSSSRTTILYQSYNKITPITVGGNLTIDLGCAYYGYNGTLTLGGNLTGSGNVYGYDSHIIKLNGAEAQRIDTSNTSYFGTIEVENTCEDGVTCAYLYKIKNLVRNGNIFRYDGITGTYGWTLKEDTVWNEDLILLADTLDLNGYTLEIKGDLIQNSGIVYINGGNLIVDGNYHIQKAETVEGSTQYSVGNGVLKMTNDNDYVLVKGDFAIQTALDSAENLNAGTLEVKGNFNQIPGSTRNFAATGSHTTVFSGDGKQTVKFENTGSGSYFKNIEIKNESAEGVVLDTTSSYPLANGLVKDNGNKVTGALAISDNTSFENQHYCSDIAIADGYTILKEIETDGDFIIDTDNYPSLNGKLTVGGNLYFLGSGLYVCSDILVKGNMYLHGSSSNYDYGYVYLYKGSLTVDGNFEAKVRNENGYVRIYQEAYYNVEDMPFVVKGDLYLGKDCYFSGYRGTFTLSGNVEGEGYFQFSNNHKTVFNGKDLQKIELSPNSYFANLEICNYSKAGVEFSRMIKYDSFIRNGCRVSFGENSYEMGWKLTENEVYDSNLFLWEDTLDLNGYTLTVNGDFYAMGGNVILNGGKLIVNGDLRVQTIDSEGDDGTVYGYGSARFTMNNPADYILVNGGFYYNPKSSYSTNSDIFSDGTIEIKGDFSINGNSRFVSSENNTVKFTGNVKQTFNSNYDTVIANFINQNPEELNVNTYVYVNGSLVDDTESISGSATFYVPNPSIIKNGIFSGNLYIQNGCILQEDLSVGGRLSINSDMHANGKNINANEIILDSALYVEESQIRVADNIAVSYSGKLVMINAADYVLANGNFNFYSNYNHTDFLTAGTLEVRGDFTQSSYKNFIASGTHTTILSPKMSTAGREYVQIIKFNAYAGTTRFNKVVLKKSDSGYQFSPALSEISNEVVYDIEDAEAPTAVEFIVAGEITEKKVTISFGGAEDNNGIVGYEIYRDGKRVGATSNTTYVDNTVDSGKEYTYTVFAFDDERNKALSSPALIVKTLDDEELPSIPQNLGIKTRTGSSLTLEWSPSSDNVKVVGYNIYADGVLVAEKVFDTYYKAKNLDKTHVYKYSVEAEDKSGNLSGRCDEIEAEVKMPKILSVTPEDNSRIGNDSVTLNVYYENVGNSTGNKVAIKIKNDSGEWSSLATKLTQKSASYGRLYSTYTWDISEYKGEESVTLKYILTDADENEDSKEVNYVIDREGPEAPTNFKVEANNGNVNISFSPSASADCDRYEIYRANYGGEELIAKLSGRENTFFIDKEVTVGGTYEYYVLAFDKFNNKSGVSNRVSVTIEEDHVAPEVMNITPRAGRVNSELKLDVTASDNKSVSKIGIQYKTEEGTEWIDVEEKEASNGIATFKFDTTALSDGAYFFNAYAIDGSGNRSAELYTRRYTVDNTGVEKIVITEVIPGASYVRIEWEDVTDDNFSYFAVEQLKEGEFVRIAEERETLGLYVKDLDPETEYTFRVVGYDNLGNRGIESDEIVVTTLVDTLGPQITAAYPQSSNYNSILKLEMDANDDNELDYAVFSYSLDGNEYTEIDKVKAKSGSKEEHFVKNFSLSEIREGKIFVKFEAYDKAGNKNLLTQDDEDIIVEYNVDRTAPSKVSNLRFNSNEGCVELVWDELPEEETDVKGFRVWRADANNGIYSVLEDETQSINLFDYSVKVGSMYIYKVAAIDIAGNVGETSNEVVVTVIKDNEKPQILGISPHTSSKICANQTFSVSSLDNAAIANVRLEYTQYGDLNYWREIGRATESENYCISKITWDTEKIDEGEYYVRAIATDVYGNESEACMFTYVLDKTAPVVTDIDTETGHFEITVNVTLEDKDDFSKMEILRREPGGEYITVGKSESLSFTDVGVLANTNYFYKAKVYDEAGNITFSGEVQGYADDVDVVAPVAVLPENIVGLVDMEVGLDGLASYDNVRITEYKWDMGNGDTVEGSTATYTYHEPGEYTIKLTVKDKAGNSSSATTTAFIYGPETDEEGNIITRGKAHIQIVDEKGKGIPYALVYLQNSETSGLPLMADGNGYVDIVQRIGIARVAAYKTNYLPAQKDILITAGEVKKDKIVLREDELIVGSLSVHRMSLAEMVYTGVSFDSAGNNHTYRFEYTLVYKQKAYTEVIIVCDGKGKLECGPWEAPDHVPCDFEVTVIEEQPILIYITRQEEIQWLKNMYQVDLTVVNAADFQFYIDGAQATLSFPNGVSLADYSGPQTQASYSNMASLSDDASDSAAPTGAMTTSVSYPIYAHAHTAAIGRIYGQEQKKVSWILRGDKSGDYGISANFKGILMPFEAPVTAHFETGVKVTTGEGLHITVMPESTVDAGGENYIQYAVTNRSGYPIYNVKTSIPGFQAPPQIVSVYDKGSDTLNEEIIYPDGTMENKEGNGCNLTTKTGNGQNISGSVTIDVLMPGETYYGTYICPMPDAVDPQEGNFYYWEYVKGFVRAIEGADLGVTVSINPIGGHYHRTFYGAPDPIVAFFGDPVDVTTGYYKDEVEALNITGGQIVGYDISYSSGSIEKSGENGYGWENPFEISLEDRDGKIALHTSPNGEALFIKSDKTLYGTFIDGDFVLDDTEDYSIGEYEGVSSGFKDFRIVKNLDSTYILYYPGGAIRRFNSEGKLTQMETPEKQTISLSYDGSNTIIKEDISGKTITVVHNENGLATELHDNAGRVTYFVYDDNSNLIAIVRPDGTQFTYTYDEQHRIIAASNNNGVFVTNSYDDNNRVVYQEDALGNPLTLSYEEHSNGGMKVTSIDAKGNARSVEVGNSGLIFSETTAKGATTTYRYDKNGNLLEEIDPFNHVVYKAYDEDGNIIKVTDKGYSETVFSYDSNGNVVGIKGNDEVGTSASYTYDGNNHMTSYTDPMGMTTTFAYDSNGLQISETRENLGSTQYGYTNGLLTSITNPLGKTSYIEYDAYGNPIKTIDANGNATTYTFDLVGNKLSETDALGNTTYYTYDCNGNCTSVKDALGNVTKYDYDAMSHLVKETYADGSVITYVYDSVGNCISKTMLGGVVETYEYDETNHVVKASSTDGSSATFTYDSLGRKTSEKDNLGRTNSFEYYPNGSVYKTTFGDGSSVLNTYNKRWKCTTKTYSDGSSEYTTYDKNGNVTSITDSLGNTVKYEYDLYGRLIKEIDAMGYVTQYEYDANDNCITKTDAEGRTAHMVYDAVGQLIEIYVIDSKGEKYSVKYEYDALGRVIATTDESGYTTKIKYDAVGNVKSTIDANGNETDITTYDSVGRAISVKEADGTVTNYSYDARGNILTAIKNLSGVSKSTKYTYDSKGRVVSVKENDALTTKVSYDSYGNVTSVTDANGGVTQYQYDSLARLTAVISSLGNKQTYTYNSQSLVSEFENARGQKTSYTYDYLGRVTSMTDELGKVQYTYDANGNLTKVEDSKGIIKRTFDKLNRVTSYTDYNGDTIKYAYDELGNLMAITYPGGEVVRYEYYKNGWLKKVVDNNGKATTYTYNALGQVATCTRPNNTKEIRTYNSKTGQLLIQREIKTDSNGAFLEEISNYVYNYNASGNITSVEGFDNNSEGLTSASFKYDSENRLIEYNGKTVRYDADGNMVYGPVNGVMTDLSYDCRNRLIYAGGVRYEYNAENTRIAEETNDYRAVFVTDVVSSELSRVLVKKTYKKTNGVVSNNSTDRLYVYGYGLIYETEGASTLYHHYNNIGSTMKLSDGLGNIIAEYSYGPYGELLEGNTKLSDYLYNGQYGVSTDENGLYYMRQRYYNSEIKRFINQDILTGNVGDSQSMNRYAYVEGNPINLIDPFGLSPLKILSFVAHTVLGVVGCIPGIPGIIANVIDAAIYLVEGDYLNAALSGLCALSMGVATFATKTTCLGMKVSKTAMVVYQATNLTRDAIDLVNNMSNLADQVNNIATKLATGEKITAGDLFNLGAATFGTVMSATSVYGSAGNFVDSISDLANVKGCFVEETEVETISGKKNIEDIEEGDYVLAEDPETGEQDYKRVLSTYVYEKIVLVHVFVGDEEIITTEEHPFYVEGEGFVQANELKEGYILRTSDDEEVYVDRIEIEYLTESIKVYNLRVEGFHTYFVSEILILVHNSCSSNAKKLRENMGDADKKHGGMDEPNYDNAAHHIVASGSKNDWNVKSQKILDTYGININDAYNGVFLPTEKGVSKAAYHPSLHTDAYYKKVYDTLKTASSATDVQKRLQSIRKKLLNGTF
ncbi:MAG: AHH domain-containing protein [Lachnospiraceae bacterium]|nr:AHH domain-containing protein [Lachnospiraceae bacterium]